MPSRTWRFLVFILAFTCLVPHRSVAGPLPRAFFFCTSAEPPDLLPNPFSNLFPRSVVTRLPTTMFELGRLNLLHINSPPEFRAHDSKTKNASRVILQKTLWPPPCPVWHGGTL